MIKYDYDRMVYANLGQLQRAQQMKKRYERNHQISLSLDDKKKNRIPFIMRFLFDQQKGKETL